MPDDDPVTEAVLAGKIPPARAKHWETLMAHDPEGTKATLATMAAVLPVGELGSAVLPSERQLGGSRDQAYPKEWLGDNEKPKTSPGSITFAEYD